MKNVEYALKSDTIGKIVIRSTTSHTALEGLNKQTTLFESYFFFILFGQLIVTEKLSQGNYMTRSLVSSLGPTKARGSRNWFV